MVTPMRISEAARERWKQRAIYLRADLFLIGMRLIERIEVLMQRDRLELIEVCSILLALIWWATLLINPHYMDGSPRLHAMKQMLGRPLCLWVFGLLTVWQTVGILLGGVPSAFIRNDWHEMVWLYFRMAGLVLAVYVWFVVAGLMIAGGSWLGFGMYVFLCLFSCDTLWRLSVRNKVQRDACCQIGRASQPPREAAPPPGSARQH
jgi:hypothetical protein